MKTRAELIDSLDKHSWDIENVRWVVQQKVQKRQEKGNPLLLYTMDSLEDRFLAPNGCLDSEKVKQEMSSLANTLFNLTRSSEKPVRFQLIIRSCRPNHYSAVDIEIIKQGVKFFNYDSAGLDCYFSSNRLYPLFDSLASKFDDKTNCIFYRVNPKKSIQMDGHSCTRFALDALFHLSNMNVFELLQNRPHELIQHDCPTEDDFYHKHNGVGSLVDLAVESIPIEFAFLFRNIQSFEEYAELPERFKSAVINKKEQTLEKSIVRHTEEVKVRTEVKRQNRAAYYKKDNYASDVLAAYDKNPSLFTEQALERDIFNAIEKGTFLHPAAVPLRDEAGIILRSSELATNSLLTSFISRNDVKQANLLGEERTISTSIAREPGDAAHSKIVLTEPFVEDQASLVQAIKRDLPTSGARADIVSSLQSHEQDF
jgi:hypothetical protein